MNEAAYKPLVVSIGPFYFKDKRLRPMEEYKLRYLRSFMTHRIYNGRLVDYIEIIRDKEVEIRQCYRENFELNSDEFTEMVMVDSVFIIELFWRLTNQTLIEENDPFFFKQHLIDEVYRDLQLLENQLPFFILETLYNFTFSGPSFSSITYIFFDIKLVEAQVVVRNFRHFVDLSRTRYLPSSRRPPNEKTEFCTTVSATDLYSVGVKFMPCTNKPLLDIEFDRRSLKMPLLNLDDSTESLFRNLIVFEQLYYPTDSYIIDYILFLNDLIKTPNDVKILVRCGVIKNRLGNNEEVSNFFNTIGKHVKMLHSKFYYSNVCKKLNECYDDSWQRYIAILKQKYFNHPWAIISVFYAIVILILTIMQATTGLISVIHPK